MASGRFYEFGPFRLDATALVLLRDGERVPLTPKIIDTLLLLIRERGQVVEKEELLRKVWPEAFVEEGNLTWNISALRKALGEGPNAARYIETIPKRGYRFVAPVRESTSAPSPEMGKIMMAVLPFKNWSGRKDQEYFSDGLTEEMITQLGKLNPQNLGVIARTSAMKYKETDKSIRQIGEEMGVSYVLEGSVRRAGSRVRVTAQLIQVSDQTHLWANSYDQDLRDILALQTDVARGIAKEIEIKLVPQAERRLERVGAVNPEAYEAYLKGRYLWNKRTLEALQKSIQYFEKAIQADPDCASAYAGLADSYLTLQDLDLLPPQEAATKAKRAAKKALRIDPMLAEAHISLAHAHFHEFNWSAAEKEFKQGLELNPSYPTAHFYYANYLLAKGQMEEAIIEARLAQALDPVSLSAEANAANILFHARHYDEAIEQSVKILETDPNDARAYEELGRAYEQKGVYERAITAFQKAVALSGRASRFLASLAHTYGVAGRRKESLELLKELKQMLKNNYVPPYAMALVFLGLRDWGETVKWLEKAYEDNSSALPFLKVNPRFVPLHSEPRFQHLLYRIGLSPRKAAKSQRLQ